MRDLVTFTTQRRGHRIAALLQGRGIDLAVDAATLKRNSELQGVWSTQVIAAEHILCQLAEHGMDETVAWTLVEPLLPAPLVVATDWLELPAVDEVVADHPHEIVEGGDDVFGDAFDR
jgi:hypothetical protein